MPEENDAGAAFFLGGQHPVVICIQQAENYRVSSGSMAILEHLDVRTLRNVALNPLGQLNRAVVEIVVAYKTTDKSNHNRSGCRFGTRRDCRRGTIGCQHSSGEQGSSYRGYDQNGQSLD
jgi:hypothetical protein